MIMNDFTSGHITSEEAAQIVADLRKELAGDGIEFFNGVSYRHLMMWRGGVATTHLTPPHDITGKPVEEHLPKGAGADLLRDLTRRSAAILREHPVNKARRAAGKAEASSVWFWGQGTRPVGADIEGALRRRRLGDIGGRSRQRPGTARRTELDQGSRRHRISRYRLRREGALRTRIAQVARLPAAAYRGARRGRSHGPRRSEEGSDRAYRRVDHRPDARRALARWAISRSC